MFVVAMGLASATVMFAAERPSKTVSQEMWGTEMREALKPLPEVYQWALGLGYFKGKKISASHKTIALSIDKQTGALNETQSRWREVDELLEKCRIKDAEKMAMELPKKVSTCQGTITLSQSKPAVKTISRENMWEKVDERIEEKRIKRAQKREERKQKEARERAIDEKLRKFARQDNLQERIYSPKYGEKTQYLSQQDKLKMRHDRNVSIYGMEAVKKAVK